MELQQNWGPESARVVLRCILEDVLQDEDFFVNNTQYALAEHVHHEVSDILCASYIEHIAAVVGGFLTLVVATDAHSSVI